MCVVATRGGRDRIAASLESVAEHTPRGVQIVLCSEKPVTSPDGRDIEHVPVPRAAGFARAANAAVKAAAPADVVLVLAPTAVAAGWLERLRAAAYCDSHVATASALSNGDSLLGIGDAALAAREELGRSAAAVAEHSLMLRPRIPSGAMPCVYIRRNAIELAGEFDETLGEPDVCLIDFSQRCLLRGLLNVAADDVLVWRDDTAPRRRRRTEATDDAKLAERYRYYERELRDVERSVDRPIHVARRQALHAVRPRRASDRLAVTVDGRALTALLAGTQIDTLETVRALAATGAVELSVIVPPDLGRYARAVLDEAGVPLLKDTADLQRTGVADVVFRPYQVSRVDDLSFLRPFGNRLVLSCLDLIGYHNPGYFPAFPHWQRYQASIRIALALVDHVVFISQDCAEEAIVERLVERDRASVVYLGVDHATPTVAARRPAGLDSIAEEPFLLCLGADYRHKNRVFALELLGVLRDEHGWDGALVLAGPHIEFGSSADEERALLSDAPELAAHVVTMGQVSESEKRWLIEHCAAVCYPTTREGFGFIPFEAAALGRPCIFASTTALAELLPSELATIVQWSARESANGVLELLQDDQAAGAQVAAINARAQALTWSQTAQELLEVFAAVKQSTPRSGVRAADDLRDMSADAAEAERKYNELWLALSDAGRELVGPGGLLSQPDQAALLDVARGGLRHRIILGQARILSRFQRRPRSDPQEPATEAEDFELHYGVGNQLHMMEQLQPMPDLEDND